MHLILVDQPEGLPVSLEEAKLQLHVDLDVENDLITGMITTATRRLDGVNGLLGRCLLTQTWRMVIDRFDREIVIPLAPVQSVESVTYLDADGVTQTLAPSDYQVSGIGSDDRAVLRPAFCKSWPTARRTPEAIAIAFTAGYGDAGDVPEPIRMAIKMHVAHLYENRESVSATNLAETPQGYDDLINDYRFRSF